MPDKPDITHDLSLALAALAAKQPAFTSRYSYYDGNHVLKYSTELLRKAFEKIDVFFAENWCSVICNATIERIRLQGWSVEGSVEAQKVLRSAWATIGLQLDAADVNEAVVVCGEAFIIADRSEELGLFYNDPRMCHLFYEADNPKKKRVGAKMWKQEDGRYRMDLYYPDAIMSFVSRKANKLPKEARDFDADPAESGPNDFNEIPIFHFRLHRRKIVGDLTRDILSLQDAENKLVADLMAASEFDTFKERVFITNQPIKNLKRTPGMRTRLRPSPQGVQAASVQELGGSNLSNFITPLDRFANSMGIISRTPRHYFFSTGGNVSGDALIAMEAPLVAKAKAYRESLGSTWQELGAFIATELRVEVPEETITPSWSPSETVQPQARAQEIQALTGSGMGLASACRTAGIGEDEIVKIMKEKKALDDELTTDARLALEEARRLAAEEAGAGGAVEGANA